MENLPPNVREAFEKYICGYKKAALDLLEPGTKFHSLLCILESLKANKGKVTERTKDMLFAFKKNWPCFEADRYIFQSILMEYDHAKNKNEKEALMKYLDRIFLKF